MMPKNRWVRMLMNKVDIQQAYLCFSDRLHRNQHLRSNTGRLEQRSCSSIPQIHSQTLCRPLHEINVVEFGVQLPLAESLAIPQRSSTLLYASSEANIGAGQLSVKSTGQGTNGLNTYTTV